MCSAKIELNKLADLIEYTHKSSEIIKLKKQCQEIAAGKRIQISQEDINDAFDAFGSIVKNLSNTHKEELNLQKAFAKHLFNTIMINNGIHID